MQNQPAKWAALFASAHVTEYRFDINGIAYYNDRIKDTPVITKPLLDSPTFGRVCTGQLQVTIFPVEDIPKAAPVNAYCRLKSPDGTTTTDWVPQGKFYITSRSGTSPLKLTCLDNMIKAGQTYRDKSAFTEWPQSMSAVVNEISSIMGVPVDSRTKIQTGKDYVVSYPNDDTLISEVLGMIAAVHGGSWIMTEAGKLRLVPFTAPDLEPLQVLGLSHGTYTKQGKPQTITRVILVDDAENQFTSGDDTGMTISVRCDYATQEVAAALCNPSSSSVNNGCLDITAAAIQNGCLKLSYGEIINGNLNIPNQSVLYGAVYEPYDLQTAYLNPCLELGDTISFNARDGTLHTVVLQTIVMNCTVSCTCNISAGAEEETEEEYPFISPRDLSLKRTLKTNQTYFGNRITRSEGFVSELVVNDLITARLTANASTFSMQSYDEESGWVDRIYFNTTTGKYTITADVDIIGMVTFNDLSTSGATIINGDNIKTGTISANRIDLTDYSTTEETENKITSAIQHTIDGLEILVDTKQKGQNLVSTIELSSDGVVLSHGVITGTTAEQAAEITTNAINGISLSVKNGEESSVLTLSANGTELSSKTIKFSGMVTFDSLSTAGSTTINGDNIKTGTIDASMVNVTNLNASNITSGTIRADLIDASNIKMYTLYTKVGDASYPVITGSYLSTLYIGGDGVSSLCFSHIHLFSSATIYMGYDYNGTTGIAVNFNSKSFSPNVNDSGWSLGEYYYWWTAAYIKTLNVTTVSASTINATTLSVNSISTSSISGLSSLSVSGGVTANTLYFGGGSYSLSRSSVDFGSLSLYSGNIYSSGNLSVSGNATIGSSYSSIGFFGHSPRSRESFGYSSISSSNVTAAVSKLANILIHLGLMTN